MTPRELRQFEHRTLWIFSPGLSQVPLMRMRKKMMKKMRMKKMRMKKLRMISRMMGRMVRVR